MDFNNIAKHLLDTIVHITNTERTNWNNASTNSHTHSNKTTLDNITDTQISTWNNKIDSTKIGYANGVAQLDSNGFVPSSQLPSYVDDVINGTLSTFPTTGETGKIYLDIDSNLIYRWNGNGYTPIPTGLALGETSSTAYAGDKGKATTDSLNTHKSNTSNPHNVTASQVGALPISGGITTGDIEIDTSNAPQVRAKNTTSNNTALMQPSSTAGEYVFGGNTDGSKSVPTSFRLGQNKLQYAYSGNIFDIYHTGNKPSAIDIGLGNVTNDKQLPLGYLDTTATLGTSDVKVPSQKAVKAYTDNSIANIQIGGRNLLLNSSFATDTDKWSGPGTIENGSLKLVGASGYVREEQDVNVLQSTQYTLSFDLVDQTDASSCAIYMWEHKADGTTTAVYVDNYAAFSTIGRNFYTRTTQPDCAKLYILIQANAGKTIHVKNVKLEQGTKPSSASPAFEDIQANIDYVQVGGRNYMTTYSLNQTIINPASNYNSYDFGHTLPEANVGTGMKKYYTLSIVYVPTSGKSAPFSNIVLGQGTDGTAWGNRLWAGNGVIKKYDSTRYRWTCTFLIDGTTSAYLYNYIKIICENVDNVGCTINYLQLEEGTRGTSIKIPQELMQTKLTTPTLNSFSVLNSWAVSASPYAIAGYYKTAEGIVKLQGHIYGGSYGTTFSQLPAGYRPSGTLEFLTKAVDTSGNTIIVTIAIDSSGNININSSTGIPGNGVSLDIVNFLATN